MAENRPKTPARAPMKHDVYDEAIDADIDADIDDEEFDDDIDATRRGSLESSKLTLESARPSTLRAAGAAGAAGALSGAGALFDDNVTLESVPPGFHYVTEGPDEPAFQQRFSHLTLGLRPSDDSFDRANLFTGQAGIVPPDFRLESRADTGEEDVDDDDDTDEDKERTTPESDEAGPGYDPEHYAALPVSPLVKALFPMIMEYTPGRVEWDRRLHPWVPEMIPAIGDIDAFIKIPRPDKKQDMLGLSVLDEPACEQTDPQKLALKLKAFAKGATGPTLMAVKTLPDAEDVDAIDEWMDDVDAVHKENPPTKVYYSNPMPDMDQLMQAWPPEVEQRLNKNPPKLPDDSTLAEAVDMACNILDIPVHAGERNGRIQALHQMMTLYLEFKRSQHFKITDD